MVTSEKIFAIGDIHGCFDKLTTLMEKFAIDHDHDTLVFLGDYIDRGDRSFEVVEYLIDLEKRFRKLILLKGNHEAMLEDFLSGTDRMAFLMNGGQRTLDSYFARNRKPRAFSIPHEHRDFFRSLRLFYQTDQYIFVHAGLREGIPLERQDEEDLLWIRDGFVLSEYDFGKQIVFGHTVFPEPLIQPNKIGIDTGAVYGNKLTCIELSKRIFYYAE